MKSAKKKDLVAVAMLLAFPTLAAAHNYTYIEGGFLHRDFDPDRDDKNGFRVAGSINIISPIAAFAEYDHTGELHQLSVGGLFHVPLNHALDLNLGASVEHVDTDHHGDDTGYGLRGGVRWQLDNAKLELSPELRYTDVLNSTDVSGRIGVLYALTPELDLQGALQGGDDDRVEVGLRYNFGPRLTHGREGGV